VYAPQDPEMEQIIKSIKKQEEEEKKGLDKVGKKVRRIIPFKGIRAFVDLALLTGWALVCTLGSPASLSNCSN
jgi:hypothetical protein